MRRFGVLFFLFLALPMWAAQVPRGKFQCRRYPTAVDTSPYGDPVALIWFHPNGVYDFLDLSTTKGKTSGHYAYRPHQHEIDWMTGDLSKYVGHDIPEAQKHGITAIRLNTKADPDGKVDGTLRCFQVLEQK